MKRTIIHVFHIGAGIDVVNQAIATIEGLQNWWSKDTSGSAAKDNIIQFRFGDVFKPDMKVIENTENRVQWECVAGEKEWLGDKFTFFITDKKGSVSMKFTQEYANEITEEQFGTFNFNWGYYLNSLKQYCETGKGNPWYNKPNK
ncbi:MAG: hypothetical protein Q8941_00550 [Bacteroidota bacterium]|nr:hypothetical protein [Bacteroidota bacterium]